MFIDQLEMIAFKTQGNLDKDEDNLLQQSLMNLRLAFVEAVENAPVSLPPSPSPLPVLPRPDLRPPPSGDSQPIIPTQRRKNRANGLPRSTDRGLRLGKFL
jgi:hypothetical protein